MIYERILSLCRDRDISVRQLEKLTGIGNGVIGGWRESFPRVDRLQKVAEFFGVTVDYFLS